MISPRHARSALLSVLTIATLAACTDGAESESGPVISTSTSPTAAGPSTSAAATSSTTPTTALAPTTATPTSTGDEALEPRPITAIVAADEDGCRFASDLGTSEQADLVVPDDVAAEEDTLLRGRGSVTDEPLPNGAGCDGSTMTVTFESADQIGPTDLEEPDPAELESIVFDQAWECGRGFTMSDSEQRWAINIEPVAGNSTQAAGETITIPDDRFGVGVTSGIDLIAGNCETGREPFDPTSILVSVWRATEGSFVYPDATVICDGSSASTELVDAVVQTPDGPVELPPIAMVNTAFACGPGWDD
ncbi:MAG: hypothetical protein CL424_09970 [Acidimicrobiaceae bacterium]|nr:hypothetical protein [Acidimicrobiaceae bacterium]